MSFDLKNLLNDKSKGETDKFEITMLDVSSLVPSEDNFYSVESVEELSRAIELVGGIEQNLLVKPPKNGKYEVIAGHRRRLAVLKLIEEGKEEFRLVPCRIKKKSESIRDKLSLILTNATARQLTDWEKVQQAKVLKETLTEYKNTLKAEGKGERIGRIREIVAEMLKVSSGTIARMEKVENSLSEDFKTELKEGNIGISTAYEISRHEEEKQEELYKDFKKKGKISLAESKEGRKESEKAGEEEKAEEINETEEVGREVEAEKEEIKTAEAEKERRKAAEEEIRKEVKTAEADVGQEKRLFENFRLDIYSWASMLFEGHVEKELEKVIYKCMAENQGTTMKELSRRLANRLDEWFSETAAEYHSYERGGQ